MKTFRQSLKQTSALLGLAVALALPNSTPAATRTWTGGSVSSGNWTVPANWDGGVSSPSNGDDLVFPAGAGRLNNTNNFVSATFNSITFSGTGYSVRGNALKLTAHGPALPLTLDPAIKVTGGAHTIAFYPDLQFTGTNTAPSIPCSGTLTLYGDVDLNGRTVTFDQGDVHLAGAVSGAGNLWVKLGTDLYLEGSTGNTFAGYVANLGRVYLNKTSGHAIPAEIKIGASTFFPGPGEYIWLRSNQVADSASVDAYGTFNLNGFSDTIGDLAFFDSLSISNGTLSIGGDVRPSANIFTPDTPAKLQGNGRVSFPAGTHTFYHTNTLMLMEVSLEIAGAGTLVKEGVEPLILSASNSFTGTLELRDGETVVSTDASLGSAAGATVLKGGTLRFWGQRRFTAEPLQVLGSGSLLRVGCESNVWSGPVQLDSSLMLMACDTPADVYPLTLTGVISGPGGLTLAGGGPVLLAGASPNDFTGALGALSGTVVLGKPAGVRACNGPVQVGAVLDAPGTYSAASVRLRASEQIPNGSSVSVGTNGVFELQGFSETIGDLDLHDGRVILGNGTLTVQGDLQATDEPSLLAGSFIYGGGRIEFPAGQHTLSLPVLSGGAFQLTIQSEVSGAGSLVKSGPGALFLSASNSFTGSFAALSGRTYLNDPAGLGSAAAGTTVYNAASLGLFDLTISGEPLTLRGGGTLYAGGGAPATWAGPITLPDADEAAFVADSGPGLTLSGVLSGPGDLVSTNQSATIIFAGTAANTQSGEVRVLGGSLWLSKTNATAIAGGVRVGNSLVPGAEILRLLRPNQIADTGVVVVATGGRWELNGFNETIGELWSDGATYGGEVALGGATLTLEQATPWDEFGGTITGAGGFTKRGGGSFTLNGDNTYTGTTLVQQGRLEVEGEQPTSPVAVLAGATLAGRGTVGHLTASPGATVTPDEVGSSATLTTSNLILQAASTLQLRLRGHGSNDQLRVRGSVTLNTPTLALSFDYLPQVGDTFTLIDNDGMDLVIGTFAGLPGGTFTGPGGVLLEIAYGNDVTLRVVSPGQEALPPGIGVTVLGGNGNGAVEPNECNQIRLAIFNASTNPLPAFHATLSCDLPAVATFTQPASDFPAIPPQGRGTNLTLFQLSTTSALTCGSNLPCHLLILTTNNFAFQIPLALPTGMPGASQRYDDAPNAPVLDGLDTESSLLVDAFPGYLARVEVGVFIEHSLSSDLTLTLVSPDGVEITLADSVGSGANYGTNCADAARTWFADDAAASITTATAPFVGWFRPAAYLSVLRGLPASSVVGKWILRVRDNVHFNTGTLRCWSLVLAPAQCTDGGGECERCPAPIVDALSPASPIASGFVNRDVFASPSTCLSNTPCGSVVPANVRYRAHSFTNLSSQPTCVTVSLTPQCVDDPANALAVAAYLGAFNPGGVCDNFLGDPGQFAMSGQTRTFAVQVPAQSTFEVVVTALNSPNCSAYKLTVASPDLCPVRLGIAAPAPGQRRLDWPSYAGGYELERAPLLAPANWSAVTNPPVISNGRFVVTNEVSAPNGFYRLRKP